MNKEELAFSNLIKLPLEIHVTLSEAAAFSMKKLF